LHFDGDITPMRTRRSIVGTSIAAIGVIAVLVLLVMTRGVTPSCAPAASFGSVDTSKEGVVNLTLYISNPTDSSAVSAYLSVSGTNSWAHAVLT
jgi:hypothetical protein